MSKLTPDEVDEIAGIVNPYKSPEASNHESPEKLSSYVWPVLMVLSSIVLVSAAVWMSLFSDLLAFVLGTAGLALLVAGECAGIAIQKSETTK